jgi:NADH-quinone oxidoreductase subunit J
MVRGAGAPEVERRRRGGRRATERRPRPPTSLTEEHAVELIMFVVLAVVLIGAAIMVVAQKNPVYSALFLILAFLGLAGQYVLLHAQLIAVLQVIVYAGAIMVLFLFVVMLLNVREGETPETKLRWQKLFGVVLAVIFLVLIGLTVAGNVRIGKQGVIGPEKLAELGNAQVFGKLLFTDFLFLFEATSVLLLVAMIGAIVLARRQPLDARAPAQTTPASPLE